jgi:hypothetical protein
LHRPLKASDGASGVAHTLTKGAYPQPLAVEPHQFGLEVEGLAVNQAALDGALNQLAVLGRVMRNRFFQRGLVAWWVAVEDAAFVRPKQRLCGLLETPATQASDAAGHAEQPLALALLFFGLALLGDVSGHQQQAVRGLAVRLCQGHVHFAPNGLTRSGEVALLDNAVGCFAPTQPIEHGVVPAMSSGWVRAVMSSA